MRRLSLTEYDFQTIGSDRRLFVEIEFTAHALARMTQRQISVANIESVLKDFHFSVASIRSGMRIEGNVDG